MAGNIFVSYRRDDSKHAAGRLVDRLHADFDEGQIFLDVDNIELGLDFVEVLNERVAECDIMLVVIGPFWLTASDASRQRLEDPNDFVRLEVEAALKRNIRVIPVLVDGAEPPRAEDLPESLAPLANRQSTQLSHENFTRDAKSLTTALRQVVGRSSEKHNSQDQATAELQLKDKRVHETHPPSESSHNYQRRTKPDVLGWLAALSPVILFPIEFLVEVVILLTSAPIAEPGGALYAPPERIEYFLPLTVTLILWAARGLSSRGPVSVHAKIVGGLLFFAYLLIAMMRSYAII